MDKLVAKINWSFNRWKGFDWEAFRRRYESGFEFVRQTGYAHEWWNFYEGFSPDKYYGTILNRPKRFRRGIVLFISMNPLDGRWYFVGFYGDAVRPPTDAPTGTPLRDLLPEEVIRNLTQLVRAGEWEDRHLSYISQVLNGREYQGTLVARKRYSASFLPEAYIEVSPDDLGVGRIGGQWKITYKITSTQIRRLLETAKRRHEKIESKEAKIVVERINRTLKDFVGVTTESNGPRAGEESPRKRKKLTIKIPDDLLTLDTKKPSNGEIPKDFPQALLSRYEPLEFLGEGGFARVYKVKRRKDGKIVALKIPRIDERTSGLFVKEVAAWYNLNHENIVRLYRADILPVPYLEMEFVEGAEIDGELFRDLGAYPKPVPERMAIKLITGIAEGLKHAHSKGIYHLDLKPLNVLLKADLTPKITDWGLAKISARSSLSRHYGYSPLYAAPEQLDEETYGEPDGRTDVYQLGLIFYELLTGELPYKATSPGALVGKILHAKPKPMSELKPELKRLDGVFEKLLAKRKEERYQSVKEFLNALESLSELEREKGELIKTGLALRRSRSREEFERLKIESARKTVKVAVLAARLNDKAELLAALDDLKFYTEENLDDLLNAIAQVEMLLKEGIPISSEVEEKVRALLLRIEREVSR
ncbi:Serine/threonine protein kinase, putative S-layer protein [Thermococcus sp. 4557]|uniref:serine/threonine-protein kinase n=1 Tax=Thermococcus sp. (strain CGMCC 1.5172 / 4557) TaxID=1042877 RepID=UPI000219E310|nr:serine/threonine-protein kinase [Thermococcus sp. 4557]AEK71928.1 Serine/threonine protein kinase, putative S-layer protein [Thermococcus sp. 4557]